MEGAAKRRLPPFLSLRCGWNFIPNSETETFSQLPYRAALGARPRRRGDRMKRREFMSSSERVPGRGRREFEIADIRAQPYPHPRADRDHDDVVHRQRRHSQAADQVSRTLDADVIANWRPLAQHPDGAGILGVEDAFPVAQPRNHRAAACLAQHVTVGEPELAARLLDDLRELTRNCAEKAVTGIDNFIRGVLRALRLRSLILR